MLILAIRTDKPEAELYLLEDTKKVGELKWQAHRELSDTIHLNIQQILNTFDKGSALTMSKAELVNKSSKQLNDLQGLICFSGPGSFTGLRIGAAVANALAYSLGIPVVGLLGADWLKAGIDKLSTGQNDRIVALEYGSPPNITARRK